MTLEQKALFYALAATLCFSTSSMVFAIYAEEVSPYWMNAFKAVICLIAITISMFLVGWVLPASWVVAFLMLSGFLGLFLGDFLLIKAYTLLGPARTLMIFGFQPLVIGAASHYLFQQNFTWQKLIAIFFLISCILIFSIEKFKEKGHWEVKGFVFAISAILLDGSGVLLTRYVFDQSPELHVLQGNFYRTVGAVLGFGIASIWYPAHLWKNFISLPKFSKGRVLLASFAGTFLSLLLYLTAIKTGHLASVGAVGLSGPMFAALFECFISKKIPSYYFFMAFAMFAIGTLILLQS